MIICVDMLKVFSKMLAFAWALCYIWSVKKTSFALILYEKLPQIHDTDSFGHVFYGFVQHGIP